MLLSRTVKSLMRACVAVFLIFALATTLLAQAPPVDPLAAFPI
jgi:hypothetical protein